MMANTAASAAAQRTPCLRAATAAPVSTSAAYAPAVAASSTRAAGAQMPSTPVTTRLNTNRGRSEEHTSELQSRLHLVCRLLLEKKKKASLHVEHPGLHV